jgi:hypothetical protein
MKWPEAASEDDVVIVREDVAAGRRFVVHGSRGPQLVCKSYAEAEAQALAYAEHACTHAWYIEGRRLQLVGSFVRVPVSPPATAQLE